MFDILDTFLVAFTDVPWHLFVYMAITFWVFHWAFRLARGDY